MKYKESFWVTNISNMNVSLSDLNLTIRAFSSVNLLDDKHYSFTKNQLIQSASQGSLFKKRNKIFIRKVNPEINNTTNNVPFKRENMIPSREKSIYIIKNEKYEELNLSDVDFASENAELAEMDTQPLIKKG